MSQLVDANLQRLPLEMRERAQWCLAGPDKAPYLVGANGAYRASPIQGPWMDFDTAVREARRLNYGIGYMLTAQDGLTCIDIDIKDVSSRDKNGNPLKPEQLTTKYELEYYRGIVQIAESYTELSQSGKGLHIWVKGSIGEGRRGKGMEVYSQERFMICTGRALSDVQFMTVAGAIISRPIGEALAIADGTDILNTLVRELSKNDVKIDLVEVEAEEPDEVIWKRARSAVNAFKFSELCSGRWQQFKFPSQSEADLALMSMFTYYSKSNEQCRRMFRMTMLGQRDKAVRDDVYLDRTLAIIRGRQARDSKKQEHGRQLAMQLLQNLRQEAKEAPAVEQTPAIGQAEPIVATDPATNLKDVQNYVQHLDQTRYSNASDNVVEMEPPNVDGIPWPPGLVGAIAGFIYRSAPRPVKEVAIVAALGLMAGIVGKSYNIGQTGLNLYIILVARSAIGKEAMHSGIGHILRSRCGTVLTPYVNFTDYASGPALTKAMEESPSFVNVAGEFGRKLQRMADDRREGPMQQLRTVMTNLYQKSGVASVMGGLGYSNKEQNVKSINAVAYSMIGETTPGTFYDSLTSSMMEDGFLSRFNIIHYEGERPAENKDPIMQLPEDIDAILGTIANHSIRISHAGVSTAVQVAFSEVASNMLDKFNLYCDERIREAGEDESIRQIWNRAHLKALRVSGVLAASDNHLKPCISETHAQWAIDLVMRDASSMLDKITTGEVGDDDTTRLRKLITLLDQYVKGRVPISYNIDRRMMEVGIVPRRYLQIRTSQVRCFQNYKLGNTLALDHCLRTALDSGYIMEVDSNYSVEHFGYHGRCFRVLDTRL